MVGGTLPQQPDPEVFPLEPGKDRFDLFSRPAQHLVRTVVRRHAESHSGHGFVVIGHRRRYPVGGREYSGHRPFSRKRRDEFPPDGGEPQAVLQRIDLRRLRGRDFAETVSEDHVRPDAQACPQGAYRALQRIDRRLFPHRVVEIGRVSGPGGPPEHGIEEGFAPKLAKERVAAVEDRPHDGFALVEFGAHADPLAGLAGVQEGDLSSRFFTRIRCSIGIGLRKLDKALPE